MISWGSLEPMLFKGSISNNIKCINPDTTQKDIKRVAKIAQAYDNPTCFFLQGISSKERELQEVF